MSNNNIDEYDDILGTINSNLTEQSIQIEKVDNAIQCLESNLEELIGNRSTDTTNILKFAEDSISNIHYVINDCVLKLQDLSKAIDDNFEILSPKTREGNTFSNELIMPFIPNKRKLESFPNIIKVFSKNDEDGSYINATIIEENPNKDGVNSESHQERIFNCYFSLSSLVSNLLELQERLDIAHIRLNDEFKRTDLHYLHIIKEDAEVTSEEHVNEPSEDCCSESNTMEETKQLDAELLNLKNQLEETMKEAKVLESEKSYYEKQFLKSTKEKNILESDFISTKKELAESTKKIKRCEYEQSVLRENFEKSEVEREQLQAELKSLQNQVAELKEAEISVQNQHRPEDNRNSSVQESSKNPLTIVQKKSTSCTLILVAVIAIFAIFVQYVVFFSDLLNSS